jgi:hypothetical protein
MAKLAPKRYEFMPKKPLEVIHSHLRNQSLKVDDQSRSVRPTVNENHRDEGKQSRHIHEVCEVDFKNKRNGRILSRMIRNKHKQKNDPIQTIMIDGQNLDEGTSLDSAEVSHPQYDFASNLPLFSKTVRDS